MKVHFHSDNGAPCWRCSGTIYKYTVDEYVSYVAASCIGCRADNMFIPAKSLSLEDTPARVSQAHREAAAFERIVSE